MLYTLKKATSNISGKFERNLMDKNDFAIDPGYKSVVVNLGSTKTGQRIGVSESITFEHTSLAKILGACFVNKAPGDLILPRGQADFRSVFAKLLDSLELGEFGLKPYSLRRGGATHMFRTLGT